MTAYTAAIRRSADRSRWLPAALATALIASLLTVAVPASGQAAPVSAPDAPTGLSATAGHEQVELTWTAPTDGGSPIDAYRVEYAAIDDWTWAPLPGAGTRLWNSVASSSDGTRLIAAEYSQSFPDPLGFLYTSTDSGATWTPRLASPQLSAVASSADGMRLFAGRQSDNLLVSADGGATWTHQFSAGDIYNNGRGHWHSLATSADGTRLYAADKGKYLWASHDAGATWSALTTAGEQPWTSISASADGAKLLASDGELIVEMGSPDQLNRGFLSTSTDGGANWTVRNSAGQRYWYTTASSADGSMLIAGVLGGYLYRSEDSGETWAELTSAGSRNWFSVTSSADGRRLLAVPRQGFPYLSLDSGETWTEQTSAGNGTWQRAASSADGTALVIPRGNIGAIYRGTPNWVTFADDITGTSATVTGLTNDQAYFFRVTAKTSAGWGQPTPAIEATPTAPPPPPAPPGTVIVDGGLNQVLISWQRSPDDTDSAAPFQYAAAITQGAQTLSCTSTGTSCALTGVAPGAVTVSVTAAGPTGTSSPATGSGTVLATTDVPSTPPGDQGGASLELRNTAGTAVYQAIPGQTLTVIASGFAPGSLVDAFLYSTPQHLGTGVASAAGTATFQVTIPAGLPPGAHTATAIGLNGAGAMAAGSAQLTISSATANASLPATGIEKNDHTAVLGPAALLLTAGALLMLRTRQRTRLRIRKGMPLNR